VIAVVVVELEVGTCSLIALCQRGRTVLILFSSAIDAGNNSACHVSLREVSVKKRVLTGYFPVYSD
jgi:hypothetical protein